MLLFGATPPTAAVILFLGLIATAVGFLAGITTAIVLAHKRSVWRKEMRELIASDGIKAEEIGWFQNELKSNEKRALRAVESRDLTARRRLSGNTGIEANGDPDRKVLKTRTAAGKTAAAIDQAAKEFTCGRLCRGDRKRH